MAQSTTATIGDMLRQFASKITTSSLKERQAILGNLVPCVRNGEFPDNAVKGVVKHLLMTLTRYRDRKSRRAVEDLISVLATYHSDSLCTACISAMTDLAEQQSKLSICVSNAGMALSALCWCCILIHVGYKKKEDVQSNNFKKLVEVQSLLLYHTLSAQNKAINLSAYNHVRRLWMEVPDSIEQYAEVLQTFDSGGGVQLCMTSCLMKYLSSRKQTTTINKYKDAFLKQYVTQVISSRTRPALHLLVTCKDLLRHVTHECFKDSLLPTAERALLRNPEIILEVVVQLLAGVSIDISAYAVHVGKHLATHCHSQDEPTRQIAITGCRHLAHQTSDAAPLQQLAKHFFSVLNGSEGKLSVVEQRMGMMSGVGNLSYNAVTGGSVQSMSTQVAEMFIPFLQQEVHEGTLIHLLSMFSLWCEKFTTSVPDKVMQWLKTGISQKTSTSAVRNAYISLFIKTFTGDTLHQGIQLLPTMLDTVEKARAQPSQVALVTEALTATCFMLNICMADIQAEQTMGPLWNTLLDTKKPLFVTDKFLTAASNSALQTMSTVVVKLAVEHSHRMNDSQCTPYYRVLVYCLTHGSYEVRRHAQRSANKLLSILGGAKIALCLIKQFSLILESQKLSDEHAFCSAVEQQNGDSEGGGMIRPRILADTLRLLAGSPAVVDADTETLAISALLPAQHPCIVAHSGDWWTAIVARLHLDAAKLLDSHMDDIVIQIRNTPVLSQQHSNLVRMLARICPQSSLVPIVDYVSQLLDNAAMLTVTVHEVQVMRYMGTGVYDKSVIESLSQPEDSSSNLRRENKLYSYAEQMADLELKKELEKKKEPVRKLTKKQLEMEQNQAAKEADIRTRLRKLEQLLLNACTLIDACAEGNPSETCLHLPRLLQLLISLASSPLAAPRVSICFVNLGQCALAAHNEYIRLLISHTALRQLRPAYPLSPAWTDEPAAKQASRSITLLHRISRHDHALTAPAFAYVFPLLRGVLLGGEGNEGEVEEWLKTATEALDVIEIHTGLRSLDDGGKSLEIVDQNGPELLPRVSMLQLLLRLITESPRLRPLATKCLLGTAQCACGLEPGSTTAEQDELDTLLAGLVSTEFLTREVSLKALEILVNVLPTMDTDRKSALDLSRRIWVAKFDGEKENQTLADSIWSEAELSLSLEMCQLIIQYDLLHANAGLREAAARGLAAAVREHPEYVEPVMQQLLEVYETKLFVAPPVLDSFGRVVSEGPPDAWPARCGVALALGQLAPCYQDEQITLLFNFYVERGLNDRSSEVSQQMLTAALAALNDHGKKSVGILLPLFETFLREAPATASYDTVRQCVVILMGSLAKHLDKDDPKVKPIVAKLIEALSTPSQQVQAAVAGCLPPLVPAIRADAPNLAAQLLALLLEADSYGERRGAAHGLAGLVRGLGILALKQLEIMPTLTEAVQDRRSVRRREGALFAFEQLCLSLGRLFEPYVVHILPHLLLCFGDANQYVREAADETAKAVMSQLSAHGVKLVLPSLLSALEEDSWRTKAGSVELLGAMAYCAPKQLSACLPSIVPKLSEVLTDSHLKVQKAGAQALKQIGSVIRNPEIQAIVPVLLAALQDPAGQTTCSLQRLLDTHFVHFIDAPSLALIMPVVQRAFQNRSTETRKMAAQIIGNMYSLTDQKDLSPYLPQVIPGLKQSLLDPVPEVRTVSARALGAIVRGMGETGFEQLVPWLMQTLTAETSSVDRSGAAQGLSEVVGALGVEKLHKLMPDIMQTCDRIDIQPHVRDGYIMMYIFLPAVFGDEFIVYVAPIIPSILKALADECEFVRDTALRAGQRIVQMYAETAVELLLPQLEKGLFDDNWRIRYSSVQLLGDLLFRISGVSGKMSTESAGEDDNFGTESCQQSLLAVLGSERRDRVLAGLYMGRSDAALAVRQASLHVWKVVVSHTPKTLRDILATLFSLLLGCLASPSYDKRQVAARTLGDIVRKLGEKVLPEIIPILESGLESEQSEQRQGVCIGLSEIMSSTSRDHVIVFADSLIPAVSRALIDPLPEVRAAASLTFDNLHTNIGTRALDEILPPLLDKLNDPELSEFALDGLQQVMAVKSRVVLPYLVPQLTATPVNTRALSFLSAVAGDALIKHLHRILPALMYAIGESMHDPELEKQELLYCTSVVLAVTDEAGIRILLDELLGSMSSSTPPRLRYAAVAMLHVLCAECRAQHLLVDHVPVLLRAVIRCMADTESRVLHAAGDCLAAIVKQLDASDMLAHIGNIRQAVRFTVADFKGEHLPGFCIPKKGISPILAIFREGLLNGPPELKESAAVGLGEVIRRTSAEALKPFVIQLTGPLIRVLGDRFSFNVKVAVLDALVLLLAKCSVMLKPFLPQLQTTFVKALNDPSRPVRLRAACALSHLIVMQTRVDPLFTELHSGVKNTDDPALKETMLHTLRGCLSAAGSKMSGAICRDIAMTLESLCLVPGSAPCRQTAAACLGALCAWHSDDDLSLLLNMHLLDTDVTVDWEVRHGRALVLSIALKEAATRLTTAEWQGRVLESIVAYSKADRLPICLSGIRGVGYMMQHCLKSDQPIHSILTTTLNKTMKHDSSDVKQLAAQVVSYVAGCVDRALDPAAEIRPLIPMLVNGTKEKNTAVRYNSEMALVVLLRLRHVDDNAAQACLNVLDEGMRESLNEVMSRVLRKLAAAEPDAQTGDIDDTQLV